LLSGELRHRLTDASRQLYPGEFNRSVQHQSQSIGWGFEAQSLSRALIEPQGDRAEAGLGEAREIDFSREVLSQQAVGVLVAAQHAGAPQRLPDGSDRRGAGSRDGERELVQIPWLASPVREQWGDIDLHRLPLLVLFWRQHGEGLTSSQSVDGAVHQRLLFR